MSEVRGRRIQETEAVEDDDTSPLPSLVSAVPVSPLPHRHHPPSRTTHSQCNNSQDQTADMFDPIFFLQSLIAFVPIRNRNGTYYIIYLHNCWRGLYPNKKRASSPTTPTPPFSSTFLIQTNRNETPELSGPDNRGC